MSKKGTQLSPALVAARDSLKEMLLPAQGLGLEEKLQTIDRLIKIEALEHKMGIGAAGAAFDDEEGD